MNKKGFSLIELLIVIVIIGIIVIIAVPSLLESKRAAQATAAQATLRNIASAEVAYSSKSTNRTYGTLQNLQSQDFLDRRFSASPTSFDGYSFTSTATTTYFTVTGQAEDTANPDFYINHSMVVHYTNDDPVK
ncbi:MAG TPA: prepilin-type N-terminal cleavage/methylation domain-containing protein [Acidobacteriota bacterium]|nr:prepilin-type N-terminal cleavage/methylation domain-containing protein [Acidobacteriota bacterium]HQM63419.1 prepilin-type N-terminal cleavage/methylation domain-containing protein [Acidobacteriota bacterium]